MSGSPLDARSRPRSAARWISVAASLALATSLGLAGCRRPVPAARPAPESNPSASTEEAAAEARRLREAGPSVTEYDRSPRILWTPEAHRLLAERLGPVVEDRGLPSATRALYWVLVGADGRTWDVVLQSTSGSEPFDAAAADVARELPFAPATLDGEPVATWVLREISLLMQ